MFSPSLLKLFIRKPGRFPKNTPQPLEIGAFPEPKGKSDVSVLSVQYLLNISSDCFPIGLQPIDPITGIIRPL